MDVLETGQIGVIVTVNVVLDNKRKQDRAVIRLHNMAAMGVLVKLENYRTVSCLIALVI